MKFPTRLFWIDMEMTGLDVRKEVIIECAALITDFDFRILDQYEAIVKQPQTYLDAMDDWNKKHHKESGLTGKVPSGYEPEDVEKDLIRLAEKHFPKDEGKPILAGNSVTQDRLFIDKYFTRFSSLLHYRMLDVSSWKIIFNSRYGLKYEKQNAHRALDDIRESVSELQFYVSHVRAPEVASR
ncbi:MAG: oligoribonuclease [Bdellovibrio sp.]|nr:MAG: oligoribonuclease [Bdellovibrio sp.]